MHKECTLRKKQTNHNIVFFYQFVDIVYGSIYESHVQIIQHIKSFAFEIAFRNL